MSTPSTDPGAGSGPAPRRTRQRAAVGELLKTQDEFRTAQQIHDQLRSDGASIGLTTVYRNLQTMVDAGEVDMIRTPDGEFSYRRCATGQHHHHLVCRSCGRTVEITGPTVERWATRVAEQNGFREVSHELEIFGTCQDC
ncbi:MAG TPA: transcriptional repressor [Candidatus Avipropionibacterium avicola]|uniref:Transcriptional repressor n=1 Tax=Candidatus Avipropionibacterium avicola TaxID=2840701 RepID=A0A9D1H0Z3_9ACTN|nr:transcriptional repressor [Candidatus Avipropionibacterium avicola]